MQDVVERERSQAEMMAIELKPWCPRFPRLSIWLYSKPFGFHVSVVYFAALAIFILTAGASLSLFLEDGMWLSRFGALVIVVGIFFGIHGVEGKADSDIRYCSRMLEAIEQDEFEAKKRAFDGSFEKTPENIGDIVAHAFREGFSRHRQDDWARRIKRNTFRIDAGIAVVGTLVWGFGDLLI